MALVYPTDEYDDEGEICPLCGVEIICGQCECDVEKDVELGE